MTSGSVGTLSGMATLPAAPPAVPVVGPLDADVVGAPASDARRGFAELPLAKALAVVGDRWSLAVVAELTSGPHRFNDLASGLKPIARTVLSERLRRLEDAGIITRRQYSETPARWNYRLSVAGAELARVAGVLADWGSRHLGDGMPALTHAGCGGAVMAAWHCNDCGPVTPRDVVTA